MGKIPDKEKTELGYETISAFFNQFGKPDKHTEIFLNYVLELLYYDSGKSNETLPISGEKR
jgi:hypothetical protein